MYILLELVISFNVGIIGLKYNLNLGNHVRHIYAC